MLLYCISLQPDSKIDEKIIKTLKGTLIGPDSWNHAILVLNYVINDLEEGTTLSGLVTDYIRHQGITVNLQLKVFLKLLEGASPCSYIKAGILC